MVWERYHTAAFAALAVAQPLYQAIEDSPAFLTTRGAGPADVLVVILLLSGILPLVFVVLDWATSRLVPTLLPFSRASLIGALSMLSIMPAWQGSTEHGALTSILIALVLGVTAAILYVRLRLAHAFASALLVSLVAVPTLFLASSSIRSIWLPTQYRALSIGGPATTPVIVIVFDELSLPSLMKDGQTLDADRFPGFAEMASRSTWFRNATSVIDDTVYAVPAILTGQRPSGIRAPTYQNYPQNLFTLLAGTYSLRVTENWTSLCPPTICEPPQNEFWRRQAIRISDLAIIYVRIVTPPSIADAWLPPLDQRWAGFGVFDWVGDRTRRSVRDRSDQIEEFLDACKDDKGIAPLCYLHTTLPHVPWEYLPSGRQYGSLDDWWLPHGITDGIWTKDEWQVEQSWQRYLLQTVYADRTLARIIRELKRRGLFDRAVMVVAADHGVSFRPGQSRRSLDPSNLTDLAAVPLFVKRAGQQSGLISDRNAETIDVLPTIAHLLNGVLPAQVDGQSLFGGLPEREQKVFYSEAGAVRVVGPPRIQGLEDVLAAQRRWFGVGTPLQLLYQIGPRPDLLGRLVPKRSVNYRGNNDLIAEIEDERAFRTVDLKSDFLPARVLGRLSGALSQPNMTIAIGLNGVIRATTRTFEDDHAVRFSAMLPEDAFLNGSNAVELLTPAASDPSRLLLVTTRSLETFALAAPGGKLALVGADQRPLPPAPRLRGAVERVELLYRALSVCGWASESGPERPAQTILVFSGTDLLYAGRPERLRPDMVAPQLSSEPAGFEIRIPLPHSLTDSSRVRVFAVTADRDAAELRRRIWYAIAGTGSQMVLTGLHGEVTLLPGAFNGRVESVTATGGSIRLTGWVEDTAPVPRPVRLIVFRSGHFVGQLDLPTAPLGLPTPIWQSRPTARRFNAVLATGDTPDGLVKVFATASSEAATELPVAP